MEAKEFKGTKGKWSINYWEQGDGGVIYIGEVNGIKHYTGDNVCKEIYSIVSDLHPNDHNVEHSFEGAHIADISVRNEESLANAQLIAAAPETLEALQCVFEHAKVIINENHPDYKKAVKAINKSLGL